jgi:hypothetical protein
VTVGATVGTPGNAASGTSNAAVGSRDEEATGSQAQHCSFTRKHVWRCKANY